METPFVLLYFIVGKKTVNVYHKEGVLWRVIDNWLISEWTRMSFMLSIQFCIRLPMGYFVLVVAWLLVILQQTSALDNDTCTFFVNMFHCPLGIYLGTQVFHFPSPRSAIPKLSMYIICKKQYIYDILTSTLQLVYICSQ